MSHTTNIFRRMASKITLPNLGMVAIKASSVFTSQKLLLYPVTLTFCVLCFTLHGVSLFFQRNASFKEAFLGRQSLQLLLSFSVCAAVQSFDLWIVFGALVHKLPHLLLFKVWYLPGKVLFFHPVLVSMFDPIFPFVCQAMEPSNLINKMAWIASASSPKRFWAWKSLISRSPLMSCSWLIEIDLESWAANSLARPANASCVNSR